MQEPRPIISHALHSSQALFRFVLRLVLLSAFASLSTRGFGTALANLLALSAIFCVVVASIRREPVFGPVLTHWDEAAAYAVMGHLAPAWA
jgi:hypothetical protein